MSEDAELLRRYAVEHSETAFSELIQRHLGLIYSAALRLMNGDAYRAQDVTQQVFTEFARQAKRLIRHPAPVGWLYTTTRLTALHTIRTERRRSAREQEASAMNELLRESDPEPIWAQVRPVLEEVMHELGEKDRHAVLLRFFQNKSLKEVGAALGLGENAAQMRVERALDKLRTNLVRRGISTTAALSAVISANAVEAAPAGLAATISTAVALAGTALPITVATTTKAIAMTTLQKTIIGTVLAASIGTGIYEARQVAQLQAQNRALLGRQAPLAEQIQQLQRERDEAINRLGSLAAENQKMRAGQDPTELLKLRGEVERLRQELKGLPAVRVAVLKNKLEQTPGNKIPEMKFLTEKDWNNAAWNADLQTDDGVRLALSKLRDEAVDTFLNLTRKALKKYLAANNNLLPADLLPLKPYYDSPVTDEMLQRYAFMQTGHLSANPSDSVVKKAVYVDPDYDSNQEMSMSGASGGSFNRFHDAIYDAAMAFTIDNNGQTPSDPSQIAPYLKRPIDAVTMEKYFADITTDIAANPPTPEVTTLAPALKAYAAANNGQRPQKASDLLPYLTTPEQQAAFRKLEQNDPLPK